MEFRRICKTLLLGVVLLAAGCASGPPASAEPGTGVVFGSFDMTDSDIAVTHVVLIRIQPIRMYGPAGEIGTRMFPNGEFYSPNLEPGLYTMTGIRSGGKDFILDGGLRDNRFEVRAGKATYAGSYKLHFDNGGLLGRTKSSFEKVSSRKLEVSLLRWILDSPEVAPWGSMLRARLAEAESGR